MTWKEFKEQVEGYKPTTLQYRAINQHGQSKPLFRGHASKKWLLETTLERSGEKEMGLAQYVRSCASAHSYLSNFSATELPQFRSEWYSEYETAKEKFPNYEFLAFLRHHGFPSPLLDWTESPYIAAFFAFRHPIPEGDSARIYVYRSHCGSGRFTGSSEPVLFELGPFVGVHERHAAQQCSYTVCLRSDENGAAIICPHEEGLVNTYSTLLNQQDEVLTYDIAGDERRKVLIDLYSMNITPFTLFRDTNSLVETAQWRVM